MIRPLIAAPSLDVGNLTVSKPLSAWRRHRLHDARLGPLLSAINFAVGLAVAATTILIAGGSLAICLVEVGNAVVRHL